MTRLVTIRVRLFVILLILAALIGGGAFYTWHRFHPEPVRDTPEAVARIPDKVSVCRPGQWGNLETQDIYIEAPEEFISTGPIDTNQFTWFFPNCTPQMVTNLFVQVPLSSSQREMLLNEANWKTATNGIYVTPPEDLILSLD